MRAGLIHDTYIEVYWIFKEKKTHEASSIAENIINEIRWEVSEGGNMYEKVSKSIAPEIFGHLNVKKSLLLMMIGGVDKAL